MFRFRLIVLLCAFSTGAVRADVLCNAACQPLFDQGNVLFAEGKYQAAIDQFSQAAKADPKASVPIASIANTFLRVAALASGDKVEQYRAQAESAARAALRIDERDPLAQEVLREVTDLLPLPLHKPSADAWRQVQEGETLFQKAQYPAALALFERAAALDPLYSYAWVAAGDCYYAQGNWAEAEARFREATAIEAINSQAWRFLSDALLQQGKRAEAESALISAIAAQPSQQPNWVKLASFQASAGLPMKQLKLAIKANGTLDPKTGKVGVTLDPEYGGAEKSLDGSFWIMFGTHQAALLKENADKKTTSSPFAIDLAAWQSALRVSDALEAKDKSAFHDPALQSMRAMAKAQQLDAAILLLLYKEAYRKEFETWKATHPLGIKHFIDQFGLRP